MSGGQTGEDAGCYDSGESRRRVGLPGVGDSSSSSSVTKDMTVSTKDTEAMTTERRLMNGRARPGQAYVPTTVEHIANMITHGLWIVPSLIGLVWMLHLAVSQLEQGVAFIYGLSLFTLFTVSTVFHTISYSGKCSSMKNFFHIGDRAVIYVFIAASYTPWLMLKDYGGWGLFMLWVVWIAAVLGIVYQYTFHEQYKWLETMFYVVLGVCPAIVVWNIKEPSGVFEMALGGAIYISGIVFFKCDGLIPFAHAIWHCFVTLGAVFHFHAVCKYLLGVEADSQRTVYIHSG